MPTYEYKCDACGKTFELFQSITAAPVKKCPHCQKSKARRLISAGAGLIFKGSGFYITDYRSDSYKSAAKSDGGSSSSSSSSSNGSNSGSGSNGAASNSPNTDSSSTSSSSTPSKSAKSDKKK